MDINKKQTFQSIEQLDADPSRIELVLRHNWRLFVDGICQVVIPLLARVQLTLARGDDINLDKMFSRLFQNLGSIQHGLQNQPPWKKWFNRRLS